MEPTPNPETAALRADTAPLLAERMRAGMGLLVAGVGGFAIADATLHPQILGPLLAIALLQMLAGAGGLFALRGSPSFERCVRVGLGVLAVLFASGVISDVLSSNLYGIPLSSVVVTTITATLLPWGAGPQAIFVAMAATGSAIVTYRVHGQLLDIGHVIAGASVAYVASILVASSGERGRLQRKRADDALAVAKAQAEEEASVASLLLEIGQTLEARLGQDDMLDAVASLGQRALGCDAVDVWVLDPQRRVFHVVAHRGLPDDLRTALFQLEFAPDSVPLLESIRPGQLVEIPDFRDQSLLPPGLGEYFGATSALFAPIVRGDAVHGILSFNHRSRRGPCSARERRLAVGIARSTALALHNAQLIQDLAAASQLKSEFVATMSHELRTPLNVILGYTEMLGDAGFGPLNQSQRDAVTRIERSSRELYDLVSSTLDLGRLEAGRVSVQRAPVDLGGMLDELAADVEPLVAANVQLRWRRGDLPPWVMTDRTKVRTVLKNLIGNALKFTTDGHVIVTVLWVADELSLSVEDTGVGISAEQMPVIFEMFRQGDGTERRRFGGVGLGLHIVQRLCGLLGGTVKVASEAGVGSTFTVRLPAPLTTAHAARAA